MNAADRAKAATKPRIRCPWCHKLVMLRTNSTLYRHAPYGVSYSGAAAEPCEGSGRSPAGAREAALRAAERAAKVVTS
jgi:hypothetical protein